MIIPINSPKQVVITPAVPAETTEASECDVVTISDNTVDCVKAVVTINGYRLKIVIKPIVLTEM